MEISWLYRGFQEFSLYRGVWRVIWGEKRWFLERKKWWFFWEEQARVFLSVRDGSLGCRKHVPTQRRKPGWKIFISHGENDFWKSEKSLKTSKKFEKMKILKNRKFHIFFWKSKFWKIWNFEKKSKVSKFRNFQNFDFSFIFFHWISYQKKSIDFFFAKKFWSRKNISKNYVWK